MSLDGAPLVKKRVVDIADGDIGALRIAIEPHSFFYVLGDYAFMFAAFPVAPEVTHVVAKWMVHKDAVEGIDYDVPTLIETGTYRSPGPRPVRKQPARRQRQGLYAGTLFAAGGSLPAAVQQLVLRAYAGAYRRAFGQDRRGRMSIATMARSRHCLNGRWVAGVNR